MLARWTEILPLFVIRWLALSGCERMLINHAVDTKVVALARPDVLFIIKKGSQ